MFNKTVEHYKTKFDKDWKVIDITDIEAEASSCGIYNLKKEFLTNSVELRDFLMKIAKVLGDTVTSTSYAATVAKIADKYNIPYKKFIGFCIQSNSSKYEETMKEYTVKKEQGVEHPLFATHMYITIDDKDYEYFNGAFDNIAHIDVVEV